MIYYRIESAIDWAMSLGRFSARMIYYRIERPARGSTVVETFSQMIYYRIESKPKDQERFKYMLLDDLL